MQDLTGAGEGGAMWIPAPVSVIALANVPVSVHWLTAAAGSTTDTTNLFTTLSSVGVTGVLAWMLVTDRLVTRKRYEEARSDAVESRARELALYQDIVRGVVPALGKATAATAQAKAGGD